MPFGLRWWELAPEAVLGVGLGLFLVLETSAATSAFRSGTALALMAAVGVGWLVARLLLVRYTPWPGLRLAVFGVAALAVLRVVVLPAFDDTTVVETLPVAAAPSSTTSAAAAPSSAAQAPAASAATTSTPPTTVPPPTVPPTTVPPTTVPLQPVELGSAELAGIDHRASGTAVLYRQPDASLLVGLLDIDIQPGPDYDLYVVPGAGREDLDGGVRLDDLRGNKGTQYYPVPGGTDVAPGGWTVLVWCQTFDVPVAGATPA